MSAKPKTKPVAPDVQSSDENLAKFFARPEVKGLVGKYKAANPSSRVESPYLTIHSGKMRYYVCILCQPKVLVAQVNGVCIDSIVATLKGHVEGHLTRRK